MDDEEWVLHGSLALAATDTDQDSARISMMLDGGGDVHHVEGYIYT